MPSPHITRRFKAGTFDRHGLFIEATLKDGCLSITGSLYRGGSMVSAGQNRNDLKALLERGIIAPGLERDALERLAKVWDRWHLNDMRAECEHQRALGWTFATHSGQKCPTCGYLIGSAWRKEELPAEVASFIRELPTTKENPENILPEGINYEARLLSAVPPRHEKGPCPNAGFRSHACICPLPPGMDVWEVSLQRDKGLRHVFEYRTGTGHRKPAKPADDPYKGPQPVKPSPGSVLESLAYDALAFLDSCDLDDFAKEYGYTEPTEAQAAWEGCGRATRAFSALGLDPRDPWATGA
jgi:hypothetical protein